MGADERLLDDGEGPGMLDLVGRAGLTSGWLFLRDLEPEPASLVDEVALRGFRVGEDSRDARGEAATELSVEECFEVWCSDGAGVADEGALAASVASGW